MISFSSKNLKEAKIFKRGHSLYLEDKEELLVERDLIKDDVVAPNAIKPHFVYNEMKYTTISNIPNEDDIKNFKKIGKIKKCVKVAEHNFAGNLAKGDILYESDIQNRYMIVQYKTTKTYQFYENSAYTK